MNFSVLKQFFTNDIHGLRKDIIKQILQKLKPIERWFRTQKILHFISSSILLIYEAGSSSTESCKDCGSKADLVDVRMIDFVHVFPRNKTDRKYLHGLENLIKNLEMIVDNNQYDYVNDQTGHL